jgi:nicotinamidase-related amidase
MLTLDELVERKNSRIDETHRYEINRTALIVIDMQRSFMDPNASLYVPTSWDILPSIKKMVEFCRSSAIPVIFTEFVAAPEVPCLRKDPFGPEHLTAEPGQLTGWGYPSNNSVLGTEGPENPDTIDDLKPLPGEPVIRGYTLDKFFGTPMELILNANDIRYLIMTGMMTDLCVAATLFSASMRDFRVTALTDCLATIWPEIQKAMLDVFGRKLARLQTSDQAISELQEQLARVTAAA